MLIALAIVLAILAVYLLVKFLTRPRTLEDREFIALQKFLAEAAADGMDYDAAMSELRIRTGFVKLRRDASALVIQDPTSSDQAIKTVAKAIAYDMAVLNKAEARRFVKWVESCSTSEILLPAANEAIRTWLLANPLGIQRDQRDVADRIAAMGKG